MTSPGIETAAGMTRSEDEARDDLAPDLAVAAKAALATYCPSYKHPGMGRHDPQLQPAPQWVKDLSAALKAEKARGALMDRAFKVIDTAMGVLAEPSDEIPESAAWFTEAEEVRDRLLKRNMAFRETPLGDLSRIRRELMLIEGVDLGATLGALDKAIASLRSAP